MKVSAMMATGILSWLAVSCQSYEEQLYRRSLEEVKAVARPGRKVEPVKRELEEKGYEVTDPYDPTQRGKVLWMNVPYGATLGVWDGLRYAADLPDDGPPSSILVEADAQGTVKEVR